MTEFITDLLNLVIQHSKNLLPLLELATTLVLLLAALRLALANRRSSKYDAKHSIQKKEVSEALLISEYFRLILYF